MSNEISMSRWISGFYELYKRHVQAIEIQAEAVVEIREALVRLSTQTANSLEIQDEKVNKDA